MFRCLVCIAVLLVSAVASAQTVKPEVTIPISFSDIRPVLPKDGETLSHVITKNRWPKNKTEFERNEMVLFCLGREVKSGKKLGKGLVTAKDHLQFVAGWRLHKSVRHHGDYFDGTLKGKLSIAMIAGRVYVRFYDVEAKWHKGLLDKVLGLFVDFDSMLRKLSGKIEQIASQRLQTVLKKALAKEVRKQPALAGLQGSAFLNIEGGKVVVRLYGQTIRTASLPSARFRPPHVRGDTELNGDPWINVSVQFFVKNNAAFYRVYMSARERGGDRTTAAGWSNPILFYQPPPDWRVLGLPGATSVSAINKFVRGHRPVNVSTPLGMCTVYGDRRGQDAGVYSQVVCRFDRPVAVAIERAPKSSKIRDKVKVALPRRILFVPPHTRGDREFKGNGPAVQVSARVTSNKRQAMFSIYMKARETKSDYTTAEGWSDPREQVFYTAPRGWKIVSVNGEKSLSWKNLVNYVDRNHTAHVQRTAIGIITTYGDRDGNDVSEYTRVKALLNRSVSIEIARQ